MPNTVRLNKCNKPWAKYIRIIVKRSNKSDLFYNGVIVADEDLKQANVTTQADESIKVL